MALERKSSIRKAPSADVVDVLTSTEPATRVDPQPLSNERRLEVRTAQDAVVGQAVRRPGPGRPRGKRRMEPFSSKIEINLRDELDAYLAESGVTITDFLDEALREKLAAINKSGQK